MDGNGRWAKERGLPRTAGHERARLALRHHRGRDRDRREPYLGLRVLDRELARSPDEVRFLMGFNRDVIRRRRDEMHELGVRVRWAGRAPRLWKSVIPELQIAEEMTRDNTS